MANPLKAFYYLQQYKKSAYWEPEKLEAFQIKSLRHLIKYAYDNVSFYHNLLNEHKINPDDIKSKKDLNKLPILRKDEIRNNPSSLISKQYDSSRLKCLSTSGSTGRPLFLYINPVEDQLRKARHLRANTGCGQKILDKWVLIVSPKHFGSSSKLQRMLGFYVPTHVSVFNTMDEQISLIEKYQPDVLDGYSSSLFLFAKGVEDRAIKTIKPRFVIGGAELVDNNSKSYIEKVFNVPFFDHYACVEFDRIAWQCPQKIGYHMDADALILQFVDKDGQEVAKGEKGEIVCTSLFNYSMPLIRYAIGDMGVESDDECTCGRTLPLMKVMEGRKDSNLLLPNGKMISPRAFTVAINLFPGYRFFDQFRIIQKKIDNFQIFVKLKKIEINQSDLSKDLINYLIKTLHLEADNITFEVNYVDEIPLSKTGKLMMVMSELSKKNTEVQN